MKNIAIIFGSLLIISSIAYGYQRTYVQRYYNPYSYSSFRPVYNPYRFNNFNNYYQMRNNNLRKIQRLRNIHRMRRFYNQISWFSDNGKLTGYSTPVTNDVYRQMGISPYDPSSKQKHNSINCNQELFSSPSGDEMYYNNGRFHKDLRGLNSKTGVTIIYD